MIRLFTTNRSGVLALCLALLLGATSTAALAAARPFSIRYTTNTNGNMTQIGNTIMTCSTCTVINNTSTMINFDGDSDPSTFNSSSADLTIPPGSTVLWAGLYWGARSASASIGQVLFKTPSSFGYNAINASQLDTAVGGQANEYGGFADVTGLVSSGGSGTYWVSNIQTTTGGGGQWGGWSLIVAYQNNNELLNNITVFDGYQVVNNATGVTMNVSGFLTPLSGPVVSRVGLVGWDGDDGAGGGTYTGDQFQVNGVSLYDNCNPVSNDFFNSSICNLGVPNEARYPNTSTYPAGMSNTLGVDVDLVQLASGIIPNGATSATLHFTTSGESFGAHAAAFVTNLYVPIVTPNVVKTVTDLNGGSLVIGDTMRYTISLSNTGQDTATNVILTDNIPAYTTYVPNSLVVASGANAGGKTDGSGDDQAEYVASGTPHVVFRLGTGANATSGGNLPYYNPPPAQTSVTFDVTVNNNIPPGYVISNSASISLNGQTIPSNTYTTSSAAATAVVLTPPVITKSFSPNTVNVNGVAQLNIVVSNPAANPAAITGVTFNDAYPAGLVNATPANRSISCTSGSTAGTLTGGSNGGNSIGMNPGATLAPGGSCTITVNVTSATAGNYTNSTSAVSSTNAGAGSGDTSILSVGKPTISKTFATNPILAGATSRLTLTVNNGLASALTGVAFTDTYPTGLINAAVPNVSTTCGGSVTATAGANMIFLTGGNMAASGTCTVSVDVTSNAAGIYDNTSGGVSSNESGSAGSGSNSASLTVIGPPQASKSFSPPSTRVNLDTQLIITISNPNTTTALTGVSFTDTYPANLLNTTVPNPTLNCTAGSTATRTGGVAGGSTIGISGGTLAPGGSCTVIVNVSSATAGSYVNSTGLIASANGGTGPAAVTTLVVSNLTAPTVTKAFAPTSINTGGTSTLTITLANANAAPNIITNATITDTYPLGLVNAAAPAASTTCGGSLIANPGANSVALSGGTIPAAGNCTITVTVTSNSPSNYNNNIPAGALTSANAGDNAASASAVLTVVDPPTISKSFAPDTVAVNANSTLTFTITNPNTVASLTGVAFTDTYPAGLINAAAGTTTNTCGGTATVDTTAPTYGITLTGVTLAAGASCTVSYNRVRSATAGSYLNTTGAVSSTNGGTGNTASATLAVGQPGISKAFGTNPINTNGTSVLTITLTNPTGAAMTTAAFTDTYPAGMTNTTAAGGTCAGTKTAVIGGNTVALSGGTIPANGSCTVTVTVTANYTGTNVIPIGGLIVNGGNSNAVAASATLDVNPAPVVTKSFSPATIARNGTSTLTITVQNNNNSNMNGVAFTDTYPAGLLNTGTPAVTATPASCTYTTLTAAAGGNSFALTGGTIPLNTACIYTVQVTSATEGSYVNSTGAVTSTNYGIGAAASGTLVVTPSAPTVTKSFSPASINAGATSVMTITLTNPNSSAAITGAAFNDIYPGGMTNTNSANATFSCVGTVTALNNGNSVQLSGATIPANSSCTVTVNVTSVIGGAYTNNTGTITTANTASGSPASATLTVTGGPDVSKSFAGAIPIGGTTTLTITLSNPNATTPLSSIAFTDTYPAGIVNATPLVTGGTCTGTKTAAAGGSSIALSGGTLAGGASCTVTVNVTGNVAGDYTNSIPSGAVTSNVAANSTPAIDTLSVLPPPIVTKTFTPNSVALNAYTTLTITLTNTSGTDMTGVAFTDSYPTVPAALTNNTGGTLTNTCGGTANRRTAAPYNLTLTGGTIPANGSCIVSYSRVRVNTAGAYVNTIPVGGVTTTNAGSNTVAATDTLSVGNMAIDKAFAPNSIATNASSTLTFTITNSTGANRIGITFTDTYPAGLVNATPTAAATTCPGGTVTAAAGGNTVRLNATTANLASNATCSVTVNVTSAAGGSYTNTLAAGALTSTGGFNSVVATSDTLTVLPPPTVAKAFSPNLIGVNASSTLTITLTNPNATDITGAAFADTYPANLLNNGSLVNNCGGSVTAGASNPGTLTLTGGTIPASGSCTISILTTSGTAGIYTNAIAAGALTTANAGSNTAAATANLSVQAAPNFTFLKMVQPFWDPYNGTANPLVSAPNAKNIPGAIVEYTITASNAGGPSDVDTVSVTDSLPPNTALFVNDISGANSGPVQFIQGATSSTLTYTYTALNNLSDDLDFSQFATGSNWNAVPVAGADGCDPSIKRIRIKPKGTFVGGTPQPSFSLRFRVCVQ